PSLQLSSFHSSSFRSFSLLSFLLFYLPLFSLSIPFLFSSPLLSSPLRFSVFTSFCSPFISHHPLFFFSPSSISKCIPLSLSHPSVSFHFCDGGVGVTLALFSCSFFSLCVFV